MCPRKQVPSWIPALQLANILNRRGKSFTSSSEKWMRKIKIKITDVAKCYALTSKRKNSWRFLKHLYFNNVYSNEELQALISPCDLLEILEVGPKRHIIFFEAVDQKCHTTLHLQLCSGTKVTIITCCTE